MRKTGDRRHVETEENWITGSLNFVVFLAIAAVAYTDSVQTAIMIAGCSLMLFIGLGKVGGWHALVTQMPLAMHVARPYDDPNYPFVGILLGALYGGVFYWGMDQVNVQRVLGARDLREARKGAMFATLLKLSPIFIFALPGVIAAARRAICSVAAALPSAFSSGS